jgi:hypothetical protein
MAIRFKSNGSEVQYEGPNVKRGSLAFGLPTFSTIKGASVAMMRDKPEDGGRAFFVIRDTELVVSRKRIPTRFQCYIPLEKEEEYLAQFLDAEEGTAFSISIHGLPKLENDGSYYRSSHEGKMAFVKAPLGNLTIGFARVRTPRISRRNKERMNYVSSEEAAPMVRAAIQGNRD